MRIPIKIDALGVVRKTTKIPDLMEVRKLSYVYGSQFEIFFYKFRC